MMLGFHGTGGPPFFQLESNVKSQSFASGEVMGGVFVMKPNGDFGFQFNGRPFVGIPGQWMRGLRASDFEAFVTVWTDTGTANNPTTGPFNQWVNLGSQQAWGFSYIGPPSDGIFWVGALSVRRVGTVGTPDTGLTRYFQQLTVQRG